MLTYKIFDVKEITKGGNKHEKNTKKSGLILSAALGISLIGQVAYAGQNARAQDPIHYNLRLPDQWYMTTGWTRKTNAENHADNIVSYFGWEGSGVDWWIMNKHGNEISNKGFFNRTGESVATYKKNYGSDYYGHDVYAKIKTDAYTWNPCDVEGDIYP